MRTALTGRDGITEKRMMGGVCFFEHGHMLGGADQSKDGDRRFMFRVGKDQEADALLRPGAHIVDLNGRRMGGMIFVQAASCNDGQLKDFLELALNFVATLPPKK
ncbi:MAG: RNA methyltransferase [Pseudomonadota bacterium]